MSLSVTKPLSIIGLGILATLFTGCAEGPLWYLGSLNPYVREQWAEEEKIASTLMARRAKLEALAADARGMSADEQLRVSQQLSKLAREDSVALVRIEAVRALAAFPTDVASQALRDAAADEDPEVRIAAIEAWGQRVGSDAAEVLRGVLERDDDVDVRLAATRALGNFRQAPGETVVGALGIALDDSDPAIQHVAMESLEAVTRQPYGRNVDSWREYVAGGNPPPTPGPSVVEMLREWF